MTAAVASHEARPSAIPQFLALSKRALLGTLRQGPLLLPPMLFPLIFVAINVSSFENSLPLLQRVYPGLDSFLTFAVASTIIQAVLFGSVQAATDLATDIEQGFFERMVASPVSRPAIVVSRLVGAAAIGAFEALFFCVLLSLFGADIHSGPAGVAVLVLSGALIALAFGSLLAGLAISSGSAEATQSTFPLVFILLFTSSAFFPRETFSGWFRTLADWNPLSHLVEGMRDLVIDGWSMSAVQRAVLIPAAVSAVGIGLALLALRRRLAQS
jgi:ABC-2 type transport system permease protein